MDQGMSRTLPATAPRPAGQQRDHAGTYADLKRLIQSAGLLEKSPGYVWFKIATNIVLFGLGVAVLVGTESLGWQLLAAAYLAIISVQISFIIHDTGHRQPFRNTKLNDIVGIIHGNLLWGGSYSWWVEIHNEHHANPNTPEADPHIDLPLFAFSEEEALGKQGLYRWLVRYQAFYLFPIMLFTRFSQINEGIKYLRQPGRKYRRLEIALWLIHVAVYVSFLVLAVGWWHAPLVMFVHYGLAGLYEASIFAPNHKGMPLIPEGTEIDFMHQQILTARNISGPWMVDWWYGGLNFQIEHHLFPSLPRNKLRAAQPIVREFCAKHQIPYEEASMLRSYAEIVQSLHQAAAPLRARVQSGPAV